MIKQFLQRWLGIQWLSDQVVITRKRVDMLIDPLARPDDDEAINASLDAMFGDPEANTEDLPAPGDIIEPEQPKVVKGYERSD